MADKSKIEWTDATWTPIRARFHDIQNDGSGKERIGWHCEHVSEGCRNCYAEAINLRLGTGRDYKPGELFREEKRGYINGEVKLFLDEKMLLAPLRWKRPRKIFVGSMTDIFASFVPDEWIDRIFAVMALCPQHTFQVLTKRPERMLEYMTRLNSLCADSEDGIAPMVEAVAEAIGIDPRVMQDVWPLPNVWLGVSVEDQATADERIPLLLDTPAAKRFISVEPLLGPLDLAAIDISGDEEVLPLGAAWLGRLEDAEEEYPRLDWVIVGGESGPSARPMHPDWARAIRDQCATAGVPFFFKQWGEWSFVMQAGDPGFDDIPTMPEGFEPARGPQRTEIMMPDGVFLQKYLGPGAYPPESRIVIRIGKSAAGAWLDGSEHREFPA